VWTRNRWLIALVTAVSLLFLMSALRTPLVQSRLANPGELGHFIVGLVEVIGGALTTAAGLAVLIRHWRARRPPSTPR